MISYQASDHLTQSYLDPASFCNWNDRLNFNIWFHGHYLRWIFLYSGFFFFLDIPLKARWDYNKYKLINDHEVSNSINFIIGMFCINEEASAMAL